MFKQKLLAQACAAALALPLSLNAFAIDGETCIGRFYTETMVVPDVLPPTVKIIRDEYMSELSAGDSIDLQAESVVNGGTPVYIWCLKTNLGAPAGRFEALENDFSHVRYIAPESVTDDEIVRLILRVADNQGYAGGDSMYVSLKKSNARSTRILVAQGGGDNTVATLDINGEAKQSLSLNAGLADLYLATGDMDGDKREDFAINQNGIVSFYDTSANLLDIPSVNVAYNGDIAIADTNGDGEPELFAVMADGSLKQFALAGSSGTVTFSAAGELINLAAGRLDADNKDDLVAGLRNKNLVTTVNSSFSVFTEETTNSDEDSDSNKLTLCHKNKETLTVAKAAAKAHLGHGDTLGTCSTAADILRAANKVEICHKGQTLSVASAALPAHLGHGDTEGACAEPGIIYGVHVAVADLNGDGIAEIIAGMASKGGDVEIHTADGSLITRFTAFPDADGVVVTTGDTNGDGIPEILVGDAQGKEVKVFDAMGTLLKTMQGLPTPRITDIDFVAGAADLGQVTVLSPTGGAVVLDDVSMSGGASVNGETLETETDLSTSDEVEFSVNIETKQDFTAENVRPILVGSYKAGYGAPEIFYELTDTGIEKVSSWDTLGLKNTPFRFNKKHRKTWFKGKLPPGHWKVIPGYRLEDGTLIYAQDLVELEVQN